MNPSSMRLAALAALFASSATVAEADGVIRQLPPDGSWASFDVAGEGLNPDGAVAVTLKGTITIKSVGVEKVDGAACRWIEILSEVEVSRADGRRGSASEAQKLLVPEKFFVAGENPRAHVVRAFRKPGADAPATQMTEREIESLDELLNGGATIENLGSAEIVVPAGTWTCSQQKQVESSAGTDVTILSWLNKETPFGVAQYRYTKMRKQGEESRGGRWIELKLKESGKNAESQLDTGP